MQLAGKVALVTGAGAGIGKASALRLAAAGATVGVLSLNTEEVAATCEAIEAAGGTAVGVTADVAQVSEMRSAIARIARDTGRIDIVVANAGINGVWAPIDDLQPEEWDRTIRVNLRGTYLTIHFAVPFMKEAGGSIVIISSINGTRTFTNAGATAYSAAKAAQVAVAQQLALELARYKIRVNAVCPGTTVTSIGASTFRRNQHLAEIPVIWPEGDMPLTGGKPAKAEDVADVVFFLASDLSRHVTGAPVFVDAGQSLLR